MNNFNNNFPGSWLFKVVPIFIVIVFLMIIGFYGCAAYVTVKSADYINHHGLKGVVNRIWNGEDDSQN